MRTWETQDAIEIDDEVADILLGKARIGSDRLRDAIGRGSHERLHRCILLLNGQRDGRPAGIDVRSGGDADKERCAGKRCKNHLAFPYPEGKSNGNK